MNERKEGRRPERPSGETPRKSGSMPLYTPAKDATQRVNVESASSRRPRSASSQRRSPAQSKSATPNQRTTILILVCITLVLLAAIIVALVAITAGPEDDGLILHNVYAAGVNLGGKTPEEAKVLLTEATKNTYSQLNMIVRVYSTDLTLSPDKTGATLNVDGVIDAAYAYGRSGSRSENQNAKNQSYTKSHVVSILPYLRLDTNYIRSELETLGAQYGTILSQPTYRVEGQRPNTNIDETEIDVEKVYQTLYITLGHAQYGLSINKLYDQIMEAYNTNIFEVVGNTDPEISPESPNLEQIFQDLQCIAPVNATLNDTTYEVTPGKYGYGFIIEDVQALLETANYGEEVAIPLTFLRPTLTAEDLTDGLFESILASHRLPATVDESLLKNLELVCEAINGHILHPDEVFSFNELVGLPNEEDGWMEVMSYVEKVPQNLVGGGISRVSSALYYCALLSDLEIMERHGHTYLPTFIDPGFDADVLYGSKDLSFKNTTGRPIRIQAKVLENGSVDIEIWGKAQEDFSTKPLYEEIRKYTPETLTHIMVENNPDGYKTGDVLVQPITGYDIATYIVYTYSDEDDTNQVLIGYTHYEKLDKVVISIQEDTPTPNPDPNPDLDEDSDLIPDPGEEE